MTFTPKTGLFSTSRIEIDLPSEIILASSGVSCSMVSATGILSSSSCAVSSRTLRISSFVADTSSYGWDFSPAAVTMRISVIGSQNPYSVKAAGSFSIRTYNFVSGSYYLVDTGSQSTSFTPTASTFTSVTSDVVADILTTYSQSAKYTFTFVLSKAFNSGSFLSIDAPTEVGSSTSSPTCFQGATSFSQCTISSGVITMKITTNNAAGSEVSFSVTGFRNPRTTKKSSTFSLATFDSSNNAIESGTGFFITCQTAGDMPPMTVQSISSLVNGALATYSIKFSTTSTTGLVPFADGDIVFLTFPSEISIS